MRTVVRRLWTLLGVRTVCEDMYHCPNIYLHSVGQGVAFVHNPPQITLHSVQDGKKLLVVPTPRYSASVRQPPRLVRAWWFRDDKARKSSSIPDIFKRDDVIVRSLLIFRPRPDTVKTGSTLSILKNLPLLDSLQEDSEKAT